MNCHANNINCFKKPTWQADIVEINPNKVFLRHAMSAFKIMCPEQYPPNIGGGKVKMKSSSTENEIRDFIYLAWGQFKTLHC